MAAAGIGFACLAVGFAIGHNGTLVDQLMHADYADQAAVAAQRIDDLEGQLIDARLTVAVQRSAAQALRDDLTSMRKTTAGLNEELMFYKSLMAPGSVAKGLQVSELELANTQDENLFRFELLLTQTAQRRSFISGDVRLDVVGRYAADANTVGEEIPEVVLSLTEVSPVEKYPLKFKFRYFQDLSGELTLPEGFMPIRVLVTAQQQGKEALQESFPWPQW